RRRWTGIAAHALAERLARARQIRREIGDDRASQVPLWLWRRGDTVVVGEPNEAYSWLQTELRRCFAGRVVVVMNLRSGYGPGYLPRAALYDHEDLYEVWQTPYARGSLERLVRVAKQGIAKHIDRKSTRLNSSHDQ